MPSTPSKQKKDSPKPKATEWPADVSRWMKDCREYLSMCSKAEQLGSKRLWAFILPSMPWWPERLRSAYYYAVACMWLDDDVLGNVITWLMKSFPEKPWGADRMAISIGGVFGALAFNKLFMESFSEDGKKSPPNSTPAGSPTGQAGPSLAVDELPLSGESPS